MSGLIAAAAAAPALAQQATPTPTPAPPTIITLPDTGTGTFSIAPRATATPTPVATPTPTPAPATAAPSPAATVPAQRRPEARTVPATTTPAPAPAASATAQPVPVVLPTEAPPAVAATATPTSLPAPAQRPWLWALLGAGGTALAALGGWLLLRRRRPEEVEEEAYAEPVPAPVPPPPTPPSPPRAAPAPAVPPQGEPFELGVQPRALQLGERDVVLDLELLIANLTPGAADAVRLSAAMISANADQDAQIAAFQARSPLAQTTEPFDLAASAGGRLPLRLTLPREQVEVVMVGGRPLFVPLVMIGVHWRGGLAIRRFGASFMIGTGGQGGKLGPIWLDRPAPRGLAATRYFRREAVAA